MITKLFKALGVQTINSQTFANGYYYEYSLETGEDGSHRIVRSLRNRQMPGFSQDAQKTTVETDEHVQECRQAFMYNYPYAFNIDGSVAIDLSQVDEAEAEAEQEAADEPSAEPVDEPVDTDGLA